MQATSVASAAPSVPSLARRILTPCDVRLCRRTMTDRLAPITMTPTSAFPAFRPSPRAAVMLAGRSGELCVVSLYKSLSVMVVKAREWPADCSSRICLSYP
jgi:hypothetical protein